MQVEPNPSRHTGPFVFEAELRPHRSLSSLGFFILMTAICVVSFIYGVVFILIGAWPVFGFLGLDALLIYIAFRMSYRSGRLYETVQLSEDRLLVTRVHPSGSIQAWTFQPYWVRVEMDDPAEHHSMLRLTSHGRSLVIGAFMAAEERLDFAKALRRALMASPTGARATTGTN